MFKQYSAQGGLFQRSLMGAALATAVTLSACGGGGSAPSTAISGQVVKGPVDSAQVCAFQVVNNAKGPALGNCVSTNAQGSYSLTVPVGSGPVWLEATGGTYVDEATGNPTQLPTGTPMVSLVNATGSTTAAMVTPLTTLAVNTARQVAGANAQVDETAVRQAVTQVLQQLSLPLGLDLLATAPVVGNNANDYGQALAAISEMVAQGTPLADVLSSGNAGQFSQAFATAQEAVSSGSDGGGSSGPTPPAPVTPSTVSASGSVTVSVGNRSGSFTPQATGFEVRMSSSIVNTTTYRFYRSVQRQDGNVLITDTQQIDVVRSVVNGLPQYTYNFWDNTNPQPNALPNASCSNQCDVVLSTPAGATHPVTITIGGTDATEPVRGTLVGEASNAWWLFTDVPTMGHSANLTVNGTAVEVVAMDVTVAQFSGSTSTTATLTLSNGATLQASQNGAQAATAAYTQGGFQLCFTNCGVSFSTANGAVTVSFQGSAIGNVTVNGSATRGVTTSTVSSPELGSFPAVADGLDGVNDERTLSFRVDASVSNSGITSITVTHRNGVVSRVDVSANRSSPVVRVCGEGLQLSGVAPCSGVTVGNDGRTVSFSNTGLYAVSMGGQAVVAATLNGTLVARGR
jgi:hypothetical protein